MPRMEMSDKEDQEFRARMDMDALKVAAEVRKSPKRLKAVRELMKKEREALDGIEV